MATNGAPDSWDQDDQMTAKMNQLNVGAATFVPNANAAAFVPSWLPAPAAASPGEVLQILNSPAAS